MTENPKGPFRKIDVTDARPPYETYPIEGYEAPFNEETQKHFPECCERHKDTYDQIKKWHKEFPNCCDPHKELIGKDWFKLEDYKDLPLTILKKISYTEYHIRNRVNSPNWYSDIKHYVNHTLKSFGGQGIGADRYLNAILYFVKYVNPSNFVFPDDRRKKLITHLEKLSDPIKGNKKDTDLNLLWAIYQRWLAAFPFEISYFTKFKAKAEKNLPFFCDPEYNPYSCITTLKVRSKKQLIDFLSKVTRQLIYKIDIKQLIEEGYISDYDKEIFDLEIKKNQLETTDIFEQYDKGELKYRKAIKKWLKVQQRTFRLFKSEKIKASKALPSPSPEITKNQKCKAESFESLFRSEWYDKTISYLKKKTFIIVDQTTNTYKWNDDSEDDFVGFFWALFEMQFPNEEPFLYTPLPSNNHYQKLVFQTFQITHCNKEKFVKRNRHSINIKASINSFKDELKEHFFPS